MTNVTEPEYFREAPLPKCPLLVGQREDGNVSNQDL
jgi:hypothetical protein